MKKYNIVLLFTLISLSLCLMAFSAKAKVGASNGLILAENTILPSLLPLLIIFLLIMKSGANDVLTKMLSFLPHMLRLPKACATAIIFGLVGGYPTGALLTETLFDNDEISENQAKRMLTFNFCGGAGFIITAVGTVTLHSQKAGVILFASNVISSLIIALITSRFDKKDNCDMGILQTSLPFGQALSDSTSQAIKSVLNIAAFVVLFSAIDSVVNIPHFAEPLMEITKGICESGTFNMPTTAAFLAFGGICIHFQLIGIIKKVNMSYFVFFLFRAIGSGLSYLICKVFCVIFPTNISVFSQNASPVVGGSSLNITLSILLVLGSFVMVSDIFSKRKKV